MSTSISDRDYNIRAELPEFDAYDDGRFQALTQTLKDGRYMVITDMGGMGYPTFDDFNVCVYRSEESFGDDPGIGLIASATCDNYYNIDAAIAAVENAK
jgi:hypothetical protein